MSAGQHIISLLIRIIFVLGKQGMDYIQLCCADNVMEATRPRDHLEERERGAGKLHLLLTSGGRQNCADRSGAETELVRR